MPCNLAASRPPPDVIDRSAFRLAFNLAVSPIQNYGYAPEIWDVTYVHTPGVVPRFLLSTIFMAGLAEYVMIRFYLLWLTNYDPPKLPREENGDLKVWSAWLNTFTFIAFVITGHRQKFKNLGMVYLMKHYLTLITIIASMVIFTAAGTYTFVLPYILQIPFINDTVYAFRFQVIP